YKYNSPNDMYAAVGFGAITAGKIISRLLYEYRKDHEEENIEEKIEELKNKKKAPAKNPKSGVIVKGIDNCLVKFSKCCNPLPGDEIIGYVTKGRGVSVHRKDCINIEELFQEEARIIDVEWCEAEKASYKVEIELRSNDRDGLVADIAKEMGNLKVNMLVINSKVNKEKIVITEMTLEVESLDELNKVLKALRKIDSVYEVKRKK
ncbi:MAG: (p)ppGpp synthetase, partial [Clostridia bacterium]|nr:(p)ppGpp synthetase [Clostridia bacterium]